MKDITDKLMSRKFWLACAAFLASIGMSIANVGGNDVLVAVGAVCAALSAGIYAACEAYVDAASAGANGTQTVKTVAASATDKATVQAVMGTEGTAAKQG